ncbi:histone-lysine N-methyltransferase SETD1B-A isoform X2 [Lutzomyia longipalpis]|uniref:histone-lysine N-methyltransferase SETD1B-A isoform X2 n=1 Tax=Lutzomyia longipalpis TaxID=7200 RepID=UPI00248343BF|nr:histone-lysine N-methyltransferase SETD1B-A isoform X2 [Lutzomyia longipalpis]
MSDIDDLLNYDENELGGLGDDVEDLDANEDELLLSDEETTPTKSSTTYEAKSPPSSTASSQPQNQQLEWREQVDSSTHTTTEPETEVTTTDDQFDALSGECQSQKNGEVSSTIKDTIEGVPAGSSEVISQEEGELVQSQETADAPSEYPSSEAGTATGTDDAVELDYSYTDGDVDDSDDPGERRNPKTAAERESLLPEGDEQHYRHDRHMRGFPRRLRGSPGGRGMSMRFPRGPGGFPQYRQSLPNENFNPQTPQMLPDFQFRGVAPDHPTSSSAGVQRYDEMSPEFRQPVISSAYRPGTSSHDFRGPQSFGIMSPFEHKPGGPQMFGMESQFRGQGPRGMDFGPRGSRHQFRPFNPNGVRPSFRPNMPRMPPRMEGMRPQFAGNQASSTFPGPPRPPQAYPGPQNPMPMGPGGQPQQSASKMPRKVLINPNFKGGVEAATTQLMMDTMQHPQFINSISSHVSHLHSDEELLRQQEEFIIKNQMHIEKRRLERTPERERERDRDYSPPRRRASSRERVRSGWRSRRGDSPDGGRDWRRRRRSMSPERSKGDEKKNEKPHEDEDEETRAYRIEIEKQKAMREKILRDKEARRRKAAEEKAKGEEKQQQQQQQQQQQVVEKKKEEGAPPPKLTPLVVTESKIISLKRKPEQSQTNAAPAKQPAVLNNASKGAPEPLPDYVDDDVGTPSPPPPRTHTPPQPPTSSSVAPVQRRLVLKPAVEAPKGGFAFAADSTEATSAKPKGIFDRLEKKIGVNEAAKRKIQRIVINNVDVKRGKKF